MSTAKFNTWQNPDGTENYKCRAWVNFNGTGTIAIRASGNVSSITDNGVGNYSVNFTNALPDANYCTQIEKGSPTWGFAANNALGTLIRTDVSSTTTVRCYTFFVDTNGIGQAGDVDTATVAVFR